MDNSTRAAVAAGVAAGYVAGRTNKGKLALYLLSVVAGRALDPVDLIGRGARRIAEGPRLEQFREQMRDELPESGSGALAELTDLGIESLAGALRQRTGSLLDSDSAAEPADEESAPDVTDEAEGGGGAEKADDRGEDTSDDAHENADADQQGDEGEEGRAEPDEHEGTGRPARHGLAGKATDRPSAREPGPKNPPAEKAKALARKAKAERTARKPGPKNPPAAKAMARKRAERASREPGSKNPPAAKAMATAEEAAHTKPRSRRKTATRPSVRRSRRG